MDHASLHCLTSKVGLEKEGGHWLSLANQKKTCRQNFGEKERDCANPLYFSSCFKNQGLSPADQLRGASRGVEKTHLSSRMLSHETGSSAVEEEEIPLGAQGQWKGEGHGAGREDVQVGFPSLCPPWARPGQAGAAGSRGPGPSVYLHAILASSQGGDRRLRNLRH